MTEPVRLPAEVLFPNGETQCPPCVEDGSRLIGNHVHLMDYGFLIYAPGKERDPLLELARTYALRHEGAAVTQSDQGVGE